MKEESGLHFARCDAPAADFRSFVNDEWEYTMKRVFSGDSSQDNYFLKPPLKAFSRLSRIRGTADRYSLKKCVPPFLSCTNNRC